MKKTIVLLAVLSTAFQSTQAQTSVGEDFILFERSQGFRNNNNFFNPNTNSINSLKYIKSINRNTAWRFGIGLNDMGSWRNYSSYSQNDTNFYSSYSRWSTMPTLSIGREWRKRLHKDVMVIGGADLNLGAGRYREHRSEGYNYNNTTSGVISKSNTSNLVVGATFNPFTGIRISWGRLALGYTAGLNMRYNNYQKTQGYNNGFDMTLNQNISVGYRFYNRKKKR